MFLHKLKYILSRKLIDRRGRPFSINFFFTPLSVHFYNFVSNHHKVVVGNFAEGPSELGYDERINPEAHEHGHNSANCRKRGCPKLISGRNSFVIS